MYVREYLQSRGVPYTRLLHPPAPSATRVAQCLHVPGRRVAKGVLLRGGGGYVLAVLPATHRIDLDRLAGVLGIGHLALASEEEVGTIFRDCERGALPPFGRLYGLRTVVDASLAGVADIILEGNTRHEGWGMRYRDYESLEAPLHAQFASATTSTRGR